MASALAALALALLACAASVGSTSTTSAPLFVPKLEAGVHTDPRVRSFREDAAPPSGCFARSRRSGAVACMLGQYRLGADTGERYLALLAPGDVAATATNVGVVRTVDGLRLDDRSRRRLDALMAEGEFVTLAPPVVLPPDTPRVFGALTIELHREELSAAPVSLSDLSVVVRPESADAGDAGPSAGALLVNTLTAVACIDPSLSVRMLEPSLVLVERECRIDEGTDTEITLGAWLCDSERARCD